MKFSWAVFFWAICSSLYATDTISLFNGENLLGWTRKDGTPPQWIVRDGYLEVVPGTGDIQTQSLFTDFDLHVEFWIPYLPDKRGQDRGNSGVYLLGRYEIQILDTHQNETYENGTCGALYKTIAPLMNACLPPEHWQSFDIRFKNPRVDDFGNVTPGDLTVELNGRTIIDHYPISRPTGAAGKEKQGVPGPLRLQEHGAPVRFRNVWVTPR